MPSFTGSAAEMRRLTKVWRSGGVAFNDLFDVLPKEEGQLYNTLAPREAPKAENIAAYRAINDQWIKDEVRQIIRPLRRRIRKRSEERASEAELQSLHSTLKAQRAHSELALREQKGVLGRINKPESASEAYKMKTRLVLALGEYLVGGEQ